MENARPLAIVGNTTITENEVTEAILAMGQRGAQLNNAQGRAVVLEHLIEQALFLTDAKKNMMEYDPAFKKQLQAVKDNLLVQFAIAKAMERVNVTEAEIKDFFEKNPDQFTGDETVSASHILVDSEEKASELLAAINAGEISFEDAAKANSSCPSSKNGGDLGEFGRGQMVPEFDEACFSMQPGELRGPIATQFGYHLIRLNARNAAKPVSLQEAREAIRQHLMQEKQEKAYRSKVNQMKIMYPVTR